MIKKVKKTTLTQLKNKADRLLQQKYVPMFAKCLVCGEPNQVVHRVEKIRRSCVTCGNEFLIYPSSLKQSPRKYCSRNCFWKAYLRDLKAKGLNSGCQGKHWKHTDEYRAKLSQSRKGTQNPNWQGGLSLIRSRYRRDFRHIIWKRKVLERDEHECCECQDVSNISKLEAHHLREYALYVDQRYDVENGVTLCHNCHRDVHKNEVIIRQVLKQMSGVYGN